MGCGAVERKMGDDDDDDDDDADDYDDDDDDDEREHRLIPLDSIVPQLPCHISNPGLALGKFVASCKLMINCRCVG